MRIFDRTTDQPLTDTRPTSTGECTVPQPDPLATVHAGRAVVGLTTASGLVGELERYEDSYRLCYVRGPEGIIIELAERIG